MPAKAFFAEKTLIGMTPNPQDDPLPLKNLSIGLEASSKVGWQHVTLEFRRAKAQTPVGTFLL